MLGATADAAEGSRMASSSDIGRRVKVYWEQDATWYSGRVVSYTSRRGCRVEYDTVEGEDDLVAWHDLAEERHEWLDGGGAPVAASSSAAAKKRARAEPSKAAQKRVAPSKAPSEAIVVKDEHGEDEDEDLVEEVAPPPKGATMGSSSSAAAVNDDGDGGDGGDDEDIVFMGQTGDVALADFPHVGSP